MPYIVGDLITADSANPLNTGALSVFSDIYPGTSNIAQLTYGYGQPTTLDEVSVGDTIAASNWNQLLDAVRKSAAHQGTVVSLPVSVSVGDIVSIIPNLQSAISLIQTNRLNYNPAGMSTATKATSSRSSSWSSSISQTVTVAFSNWNQLRYFFNTSGACRFAWTLTSPGNGRSVAWQTMLSTIGLVSFGVNGCSASGSGLGSSNGIYQLTTTAQRIFNYSPPGYYSTDELRILARLNAAPGLATSVIFTIQYNITSSGDPIIGNLSAVTSERRANNANVTAVTPTVTSSAIS